MIDLFAVNSPNVVKVTIMLEELSLAYRLRFVRVLKGEQFEPGFVALNALSRVPVLVDPDGLGEMPLSESGAILIYLAEEHRRDDLLPAAGAARYLVLKWLMFQMASVGPMFGQHNHFIITPDERGSYAARRYREQARDIYRSLDARLGEADWLAGGQFSIADIATYPWALYVERHGFDWAELPRLAAWRDRIAARPAVARAVAAMADLETANAGGALVQTELDRFFRREAGGPATDLSSMVAR